MLDNITTNSAHHVSCENKLLRCSIFIWLCLIVTAYPNPYVQMKSTFDEKSNDDDLQELHLISDFILLQHDTVIMRSRRDIRINQPFDTYISVSFLANGTKHYYDLELDCSAYSETASFDFYEHSDDAESNMKLRASLSPTCNHYIAIFEEKWISLKLHDPESFRATIASQEGFFSVEPIKYLEKQKIESLRRRGIPDSAMVYSKIQAPSFHPPLARNANLKGNSTHQKQYCGTPDTVSTDYGSGDKRRAIHKWYGCYNRENENLMLPMLILVDRAYSKEFFSEAEVKESISNIIETTNAMFQAQFNMVIGFGTTKIMMTAGGPPWNKDRGIKARTCGWPNSDQFTQYPKGTKSDINIALETVASWSRSQPEVYGLVHLLSNCFGMQENPNNGGCGGTIGLAMKGVLCRTQNNAGTSNMGSGCGAQAFPSKTWMTFAHEVGHNFNAGHTFNVGGIMDYSDGIYDGSVQFHPNNREEVCKEIQNALTSSPKCFAGRRPNPHKSAYHWRPVEGHCEGVCGAIATIKTTYVCYSDETDSHTHSVNCIEKHKPPSKERNCKLPACTNKFVWTLGPDEECVGTCGYGTKFASYYCHDTAKNAAAIDGDVACQNMGAKPDPKETPCYTGISCYKWVSETWGLCSKICDRGTQIKKVHCETINGIKVENEKCILEGGEQLDEEERLCNTQPCPGKSLEQQCSMKNNFLGACLYAIQQDECDTLWCEVRSGGCQHNGQISDNTLCSNEKGLCKSGVCEIHNEPLWTVGPWSYCKESTCNVALQSRTVTCQMWPSQEVVEDSKCKVHYRPINERSCSCFLIKPTSNDVDGGGSDSGGSGSESESGSKSVVIGIVAGISAIIIIVVVVVGVIVARKKGYINFPTYSTKKRQSKKRRRYSSKGNSSASVIKEVTPDYKVNYAMVKKKSTDDQNESVQGGMTHKALYDYEVQQDDEIGFRAGEKILVIEKMDDGWYKCRNASGDLGMVPGTYFVEIVPPRNKKAAPPIPENDYYNRPARPAVPNYAVPHPQKPSIAPKPKAYTSNNS